MAMKRATGIDAFLPLKTAWFHILLALADEPRHGYAIRSSVEELTDGSVRLWPAMLYGSIRQMGESGLLEPLEGDADPDEDGRRRYYRLTPLGRQVLVAETERLRSLVEFAERTRAVASG